MQNNSNLKLHIEWVDFSVHSINPPLITYWSSIDAKVLPHKDKYIWPTHINEHNKEDEKCFDAFTPLKI